MKTKSSKISNPSEGVGTCQPDKNAQLTFSKSLQRDFCKGVNHLDLSNTQIKNIAIQYVEKDIDEGCSKSDTCMNALANKLRYKVDDHSSCPAPLFTAEDISLQQVKMDVAGDETEWVAVVNLNTKSKDGYLQRELPYCESRNYLIGTEIKVRAYYDDVECCKGLKDFYSCNEMECTLETLMDINNQNFSKVVTLTGTTYRVNTPKTTRRRRLLQGHKNDMC